MLLVIATIKQNRTPFLFIEKARHDSNSPNAVVIFICVLCCKPQVSYLLWLILLSSVALKHL